MSTTKEASPLDILNDDAEEGSTYCYRRAKVWGPTYYGSRALLILLSALTSAQALGAIVALKDVQGVFALCVTLLAAYDAWLKPGAKYRAFFQANDEYTELSQRISAAGDADAKAIRTLQLEYRQINARLRNVITP